MRRQPPSVKAQERQVREWNETFPIGIPVKVELDGGNEFNTVTTTEAQMLGEHTAVIWVQGNESCYLLERVRPLGRFAPAGV